MGLNNNNQNREVAFLLRHPEYAMQAICMYYPLPIDLLKHYKNVLNWEFIWANRSIAWTDELIAEFLDYLVVNGKFDYEFSNNPSLPWTKALINKYDGKWDQQGLCENEKVLIGQELGQLQCPSIPNSMLSILRTEKPLYPDLLYIIQHRTSIDWSMVSAGCASVSWNIDLLEEWEQYLDFGVLYYNGPAWHYSFGGLSCKQIRLALFAIGGHELQV